jgi:hypothetical protein
VVTLRPSLVLRAKFRDLIQGEDRQRREPELKKRKRRNSLSTQSETIQGQPERLE